MKTHNKGIILLVLGALLLAALACGPTSTTPPTVAPVQPPPPTQQPPTQQPPTQQPQADRDPNNPPAAAEAPKGGSAPSATSSSTLDVVNDSNFTVCYLYISPSSSDTWGEDWLGEYVLDPTYVYTVNVDFGTYDILTTDCNDNTIEEFYNETLGDEPRTWTITASGGNIAGGGSGGSADFTIYNEGNIDICWLWVSPSTDTEWGYEWLGDTFILSPGYYFTEHVQSGYYDILALDCNGNTAYEDYGIIMGDQPREYYLN